MPSPITPIQRKLSLATGIGLLGAVYFAVAKAGLSWAYINASASAIWPATGIALAALLRFGGRLWPGIALGAFFANWTTAGNFATSVSIAAGNTGEALIGLWLVNRWAGGVQAFESPGTIVKFSLCAVLSTTISATVGMMSLGLGGFAPWASYWPIWLTWWLGDLVSDLAVAPALLLWLGNDQPQRRWQNTLEGLAVGAATVLAGQVVFREWIGTFHLTYWCVLPVLWAAYRFHQRGAAAVALILSAIAILGTMRGDGPFAMADRNQSLLLLQAFMGTISLTGVILGAWACQIKESEGRLRALADSLPMMVWQSGMDKRCNYFNAEWFAFTGRPMEQESGNGWAEGVHPEDLSRCLGIYNSAFDRHEPFEMEYRLRNHNGEYRWILDRGRPRFGPTGSFVGYTGGCVDITERRQATEALGQTTARLESIITSAMDAVILIDSKQRVTLFNQAAEKLFGVPAGEAMGKPIDRFIPGRFREAHAGHIQEFGNTGISSRRVGALGTVCGLRASGEEFPIEASISQAQFGGDRLFTVILRDITERTKAEEKQGQLAEKLRRNEALYRLIARSIPQGSVTVVDQNLRFLAAEGSLLGEGTLRPESMEGRTIHEVFEERTAKVIEMRYRSALSGKTTEYETAWQGCVVWAHYVPLRDEGGRIIAAMSLALDITERKRAERELQQAQEEIARVNGELERTNAWLERRVDQRTAKLNELVGELEHFSYTITHDMRAPLRAMKGFSDMLLEQSDSVPDSTQTNLLRRIANAAERMDHLITDALDYSQAVRNELTLQPVDAAALLHGIVQSYPQFQPPGAEVEILGEIPPVMANEAGLTQCFSNLLNNAVKFVKAGQMPQVRVWAEVIDQEESAHAPENRGAVRLWFEDNGIGIEKEQQDKIFGMFFRGSKDYEGTGIGLALVRKVAERMRGRVGVESEPGHGSRFWLEFQGAARKKLVQAVEWAENGTR